MSWIDIKLSGLGVHKAAGILLKNKSQIRNFSGKN